MIDWSMVTNNIRHHYKSLSIVGKEVGSDEKHLNRLARGEVKQPKFDVGVKLLDLHYDYCREQHDRINSQQVAN